MRPVPFDRPTPVGDRVVFTEESNPQQYLKLIASGDVDETMLGALEDYLRRQNKRLGIAAEKIEPANRGGFTPVS